MNGGRGTIFEMNGTDYLSLNIITGHRSFAGVNAIMPVLGRGMFLFDVGTVYGASSRGLGMNTGWTGRGG
jgi:hypothetical protein